jgi:hypothetical protein
MSTRNFYRTVIQLEVLSEGALDYCFSLEQLSREIEDGEFSGQLETVSSKEVSGKKMAKLLLKQGIDTELFMLDEEGNDID